MLPGTLMTPVSTSTSIGGNDADTELLIHADGADASTSFTDSSSNGFTITANGAAQVDTAQSKFGSGSYLANGTSGNYLSIPDNDALRPGTGDYTIDCWVRHSSVAGYQTLYSKGYTTSGGILFQSTLDTGRWSVYHSGSLILTETGSAVSTDTWYHMAFVRDGTSLKIYRDGVETGSATNSTNLNSTTEVRIGADSTFPLSAHVDEFRQSSVARYTTGFTPATEAYS